MDESQIIERLAGPVDRYAASFNWWTTDVIYARCLEVKDGNSIGVLVFVRGTDKAPMYTDVRLQGVDCPPLDAQSTELQAKAKHCRAALQTLVANKIVALQLVDKRRLGRIRGELGTIFIIKDKALSAAQKSLITRNVHATSDRSDWIDVNSLMRNSLSCNVATDILKVLSEPISTSPSTQHFEESAHPLTTDKSSPAVFSPVGPTTPNPPDLSPVKTLPPTAATPTASQPTISPPMSSPPTASPPETSRRTASPEPDAKRDRNNADAHRDPTSIRVDAQDSNASDKLGDKTEPLSSFSQSPEKSKALEDVPKPQTKITTRGVVKKPAVPVIAKSENRLSGSPASLKKNSAKTTVQNKRAAQNVVLAQILKEELQSGSDTSSDQDDQPNSMPNKNTRTNGPSKRTTARSSGEDGSQVSSRGPPTSTSKSSTVKNTPRSAAESRLRQQGVRKL